MVCKTNYRLMQVKSTAKCSKGSREHSAILSTFIKLPFGIKIFVLSIFEWLFKTGFTALTISSSLVPIIIILVLGLSLRSASATSSPGTLPENNIENNLQSLTLSFEYSCQAPPTMNNYYKFSCLHT